MSTIAPVTSSLAPYINTAHDAGFDIHVPRPLHPRMHTEYVYITRDDLPGCVIMETADFPSLGQPPRLSVPVAPSIEHGSAVLVDFDGDLTSFPSLLRRVITQPEVLTRFVDHPRRVPVRPRIPTSALLLSGESDISELVS